QPNALRDFNSAFHTRLQTIEVVHGFEHRKVTVLFGYLRILAGWFWEQQAVQRLLTFLPSGSELSFILTRDLHFVELKLAALEHFAAERFWPSAWNIAQLTGHEVDHRIRNIVLVWV